MAEEDNKTQRDLGRLEGALEGVRDALRDLVTRFDRLDQDVDRRIADVRKHADDAHARVSKIERRFAFYVGGASVVAFILTNAPQWLGLLK